MSTFGCSCESIDLIAQITKVILADLKIEDFINDRCEVSKRADEAERRRITVAKEAAGGSEQQGVLDGIKRLVIWSQRSMLLNRTCLISFQWIR
ncbi:MAG TPA: hypothetical protein VIF64_04980 [Pyrinomonadaceae bacterium]